MIPSTEFNAKSNITFRNAFEFAPVGVLIFSRDFRVEFVNNNFFRFPGVINGTPDSLVGKSIYEYRIFENIDLRKDLIELKNFTAFEKEIAELKTITGNKISVLLKCVPIIIDNNFEGGVLILEDIKYDAAKKESSLIDSQNFINFLSQISESFVIVNKSCEIKFVQENIYEKYNFLFEADSIYPGKKPKKLSGLLFKKLIEQSATAEKIISTEIPFLKDSKEQRLNVSIIPLITEDNKQELFIILISKKIREDKYLEELINELKKYEYISTNFFDGLIGIKENGEIFLWNEGAANLFGLTKSEVYGKSIWKIFPELNKEFLSELSKKLESKSYEEIVLKIGEDESLSEYFTIRIGLLKDEEERKFILLCTNTTQKTKLERELKASEERFKNIVINSHEFICILDLTGKIIYANPYLLESFNYTEEEIKKLFFSDLIDPYYLMNVGFNLNDIKNNKIQSIEIPLITKSRQTIYTLASFSIVKDSSNLPLYYNVILTDITQKKEFEKDLLLIRSIFEASLDGIALINKRKIFLVNDSFVKMFGYKSASEIIGQDPLNFVENNSIVKVARLIEDLEEGKISTSKLTFTGITKNNSTIELENSVSSYEVDNEKFIVWILRDITEEKKSKEILRLSEERYRSITENINECIWTAERIDGKLKEVFYTPTIKKITGYSHDSFLKDSKLWKKIIHPDDVKETVEKLRRFYKDPARNFEVLEYRIIDSLGNVIWIENKITVNRDSSGEVQKVFGIVNDITLSKKAEEDLKKSARELKELNEAKDRFISIISHDLRTPFSSILGFTDFLLNEKDISEDKRKQYIEFIQESAKSMLSLVNSLLDWTRLQTGRIKFEPQKINAKILIDKSLQILSGAALQKNIKLISEVENDLHIHADENLLLQAFNNLISNSIKFTNPGGKITVSANINIEKRNVQFVIEDTGIGIKKDDLPKLFKIDSKFTTTGTAGEKGSGLGLSLVHEIISKHGGDIWVESEYGKGTKFIFTIPISSTTILLVDDIKYDRILYTKLLRNLIPGYTILEAENGKQALEIIKQQTPALVITDHKMPVMSGYELVKQLLISDLKVRPPVIILSSDINKAIENEYKNLGVEYIFQKPVNLSNFKNAIEKSLRKIILS
ncbi:PAS domain S-box protein [Rosettibacter firmus]|uniref:PAS domain S-box protein n=1 Tax=Rosettibacter firmus TaxID=3111522 RepID=UPI00336C1A48